MKARRTFFRIIENKQPRDLSTFVLCDCLKNKVANYDCCGPMRMTLVLSAVACCGYLMDKFGSKYRALANTVGLRIQKSFTIFILLGVRILRNICSTTSNIFSIVALIFFRTPSVRKQLQKQLEKNKSE